MDFRHEIHSVERHREGLKTRRGKGRPTRHPYLSWTSIRPFEISLKQQKSTVLRWIHAIRRKKANSNALLAVVTSMVCNRFFWCCAYEQNATESSSRRRSQAEKIIPPGRPWRDENATKRVVRHAGDEAQHVIVDRVFAHTDRRPTTSTSQKNDGRIGGRHSFRTRRAQ